MLSPAEATQLILSRCPPLPVEDCPLLHAHGRLLRREIRADRPLPPFDRVTMDGFALRADAVAAGRRRFRVAGVQAAGMIPLTLTSDESCVEIATGAVMAAGTDAVVPYEETQREGEDIVLLPDASAPAGRNVHACGSDAAAGAVVVPTGTRLHGGAIAVAAACGAAHVTVAVRPRIAVVATGDELVEVEARDLARHQIRRSNDYALHAALLASGWATRVERFHLRDLQSEIENGLRGLLAEFDVVLLTGGISKGRYDFVPKVLADLGVETVFRGVAQRPGKPLWFGVSPRQTPVFALPGNPVSAYTCLHRYVLPALAAMAGAAPEREEKVVLDAAVRFPAPLAYFLPVQVRSDDTGRLRAAPAPFNTSGDLGGLVGTDGFVELPADQAEFPAGTVARFWRWT